MPLTSSVKELEAILQKLIKMNLDWSRSTMTMKNIYIGVDGDADEPRSDDVGRGLGATTETNESSQELENEKNKVVLVFV